MSDLLSHNVVRLVGKHTTFILDCTQSEPSVLYWGDALSDAATDQMLIDLHTRQEVNCAPVVEAPVSLSPTIGAGFTGSPGIEIFNGHHAWSVRGDIESVAQNEQSATVTSYDAVRGIRIIHNIKMTDEDVLECSTQLINESETQLVVNACAAPTILLPQHINQVVGFEGQWAKEFHLHKQPLTIGGYLRENRKGKTSHDSFPAFLMTEADANEVTGECYGFHLGWSGNHKLLAELLSDGRRYAQLGELLQPGEVRLNQGEHYQSPTLYASYSASGFTRLSQNFHSFVRTHLLSDSVRNKPCPIHYNTWEAIYFDHELPVLQELAERAGALGVERFVLDDGWFIGRTSDRAGLGDWFVDKSRYPDGLQPLIDKVNEQGMEFGIWLEPEMVNPDSELFRNHPDWALHTEGNEHIQFRHQYVLDLTNPDVVEYLFKCIDDLLTEHPQIAYIKWDMNRDINSPGNFQQQPAVHHQVLSLYALIQRVKRAHPQVEIESCCSGGGRADYGILRYTDRVWTSDSNDALDRLNIQKGFSFFLPAEIMGSHVGPRNCHITGRHVDIEMRAAVALFGHMGMEMDPRELTAKEQEVLAIVFSHYKAHRSVTHHGQLHRLKTPKNVIAFTHVSEDKTHALFSYNLLEKANTTMPDIIRLAGLEPNQHYRLELLLPTELTEYSESVLSRINGATFTGDVLHKQGIQMPLRNPMTNLTFILKQLS